MTVVAATSGNQYMATPNHFILCDTGFHQGIIQFLSVIVTRLASPYEDSRQRKSGKGQCCVAH
jgi:hypothetical protein